MRVRGDVKNKPRYRPTHVGQGKSLEDKACFSHLFCILRITYFLPTYKYAQKHKIPWKTPPDHKWNMRTSINNINTMF